MGYQKDDYKEIIEKSGNKQSSWRKSKYSNNQENNNGKAKIIFIAAIALLTIITVVAGFFIITNKKTYNLTVKYLIEPPNAPGIDEITKLTVHLKGNSDVSKSFAINQPVIVDKVPEDNYKITVTAYNNENIAYFYSDEEEIQIKGDKETQVRIKRNMVKNDLKLKPIGDDEVSIVLSEGFEKYLCYKFQDNKFTRFTDSLTNVMQITGIMNTANEMRFVLIKDGKAYEYIDSVKMNANQIPGIIPETTVNGPVELKILSPLDKNPVSGNRVAFNWQLTGSASDVVYDLYLREESNPEQKLVSDLRVNNYTYERLTVGKGYTLKIIAKFLDGKTLEKISQFTSVAQGTVPVQANNITNQATSNTNNQMQTQSKYPIVKKYNYVASGSEGVKIYEVTDPSKPTLVMNLTADSKVIKALIKGDVLYVIKENGYTVINVKDINALSIRGRNQINSVRDGMLAGNYLYIKTNEPSVMVFTLNNPEYPVQAGIADAKFYGSYNPILSGNVQAANKSVNTDNNMGTTDSTLPKQETPVKEQPKQETPVQQQTPVKEQPKQNAPVQQQTPVKEQPKQNAPVQQQTPVKEQPKQNTPVQQQTPVKEQPKQETVNKNYDVPIISSKYKLYGSDCSIYVSNYTITVGSEKAKQAIQNNYSNISSSLTMILSFMQKSDFSDPNVYDNIKSKLKSAVEESIGIKGPEGILSIRFVIAEVK